MARISHCTRCKRVVEEPQNVFEARMLLQCGKTYLKHEKASKFGNMRPYCAFCGKWLK